MGMVKRMTPVKSDGSVDKTRKAVFVAHTSLMTPGGPLPLQAVIQAKDLQQAIKKFPDAMKAAMDRLAEEAQKYQEQEKGSKPLQSPNLAYHTHDRSLAKRGGQYLRSAIRVPRGMP